MATSRKTARAALAALLVTALEGSGKLAYKVTAYPPRKWEGSPLVYIVSKSSARKRRGVGNTKLINSFSFEIISAIAAANTTDTGYTPDVTESLLDDLEAGIAAVIVANATNAAWANLQFSGDDGNSEPTPTEIVRLSSDETGTLPYDCEVVPVEVTVYDT